MSSELKISYIKRHLRDCRGRNYLPREVCDTEVENRYRNIKIKLTIVKTLNNKHTVMKPSPVFFAEFSTQAESDVQSTQLTGFNEASEFLKS